MSELFLDFSTLILKLLSLLFARSPHITLSPPVMMMLTRHNPDGRQRRKIPLHHLTSCTLLKIKPRNNPAKNNHSLGLKKKFPSKKKDKPGVLNTFIH